MSNLIRWEPMRELLSMRKQMDRIFDDFFTQSPTAFENLGTPLVDMYQTEKDVIVKATLPGVDPKDIDIQVTGDLLSIRAEVKHEETIDQAKYHLHEHRYSSFARTIPLPMEVLADKAAASMENGVLTLTLPKSKKEKPKAIEVKVK